MLPKHDDERIRRRAYEIWEREGRPPGREAEHWTLAKEEIAIEDSQAQTLKPNPAAGGKEMVTHPEPVEPAQSMEKQGDMPGLTDQGTDQPVPKRRSAGRPSVKGRTSRSSKKPANVPPPNGSGRPH